MLESRSSASKEIPEFTGPNMKYRVQTLVPKLRLTYFITFHPIFL